MSLKLTRYPVIYIAFTCRFKCSRCRKQKPAAAAANYVADPALEALKAGQEIAWQEVIDPTSKQMCVLCSLRFCNSFSLKKLFGRAPRLCRYYYNKVTGATQWERPAELGAAPMATGM